MQMHHLVLALTAILAITNPIGAVPIFGEITAPSSPQQRRRDAVRVAATVAAILAIAALAGSPLLHLLGISVDALRAAGGLIIVLMGVEMLGGNTSRLQGHHGGPVTSDAEVQDSLVVPLAMPLIAGPGAIATVITLAAQDSSVTGLLTVLVAAAVASLVVAAALASADVINTRLSQRGHAILIRFLGLILASIGAQALLEGATAVVRAQF